MGIGVGGTVGKGLGAVGICVGKMDGAMVGVEVGTPEGCWVGLALGSGEGLAVGTGAATSDGKPVGAEGCGVGMIEGTELGKPV